jgi:molecular chaperone HscB
MNDPFDLLRIDPAFDVDLQAVEKRVRDLSRVLHPDRHAGASPAERRLSLGRAIDVNEAWRVVRDPIRRAEALLARAGVSFSDKDGPKPDPGFLMDFMQLREALAEAKHRGDPAAVERLATTVAAKNAAAVRRLSDGFSDAQRDASRLGALAAVVGELRYYRRFLDEVGEIEEARTRAAAP